MICRSTNVTNRHPANRAAGVALSGALSYASAPSVSGTLPRFRAKDPISALTHFIGFLAAIAAMPLLLLHGAYAGIGRTALISLAVFSLSMIALYGASSAYHTFNLSAQANRTLKKLDHSMIFVLIAGSYTPVCVIALGSPTGFRLLVAVWCAALLGIAFKLCWVTCPKWVSSIIYIGMGWLCLTALGDMYRALPAASFWWLFAGGVIYTVGGVIYALKLPILQRYFKSFGAHELFHLFVMGGSLCHFITMYTML